MRVLTLFLIAGLVLAMTGPAWALTVPTIGNGALYAVSRNQDNGTAYWLDSGTPEGVYVYDLSNPDPTLPTLHSQGPRGGQTGEDGWGLALMREIDAGIFHADTNSVEQAFPVQNYYTLSATSDTWLVGTFWGVTDTQVTITVDGSGKQTLDVLSSNLNFVLYAVQKDQLDANVGMDDLLPYVAGSRQPPSEYTGWLDPDAWAAGTYVKLLDGVSTSHEFVGSVNLANGKFTGHTDVYFDVDENGTGLWDPYWGVSGLFTDGNGNPADMYFSWGLENGQWDWDTTSRDFGGAQQVPEPATMVLVSLGGLGVLFGRKRK